MTMTLVETIEVGAGGAASIEFTNIGQDGTDLLLKISHRGADGGAQANLTFNNDTGTNYNIKYIRGSGSSVNNYSFTNQVNELATSIQYDTYTANTYGNAEIYVPNYTSSTTKSVSLDAVSENNASTAFQIIAAQNYVTTSAITSLKLSLTNFKQYSTASLYIITAA